MSWSVSAIGKPANVVKYLKDQSEKQSGQSKVEYDDALPHLVGLVEQVFSEGDPPCVKISANGSGFARDGKQVQRSCSVVVETNYTTLV